jgi:acyl-CoA-binding protein
MSSNNASNKLAMVAASAVVVAVSALVYYGYGASYGHGAKEKEKKKVMKSKDVNKIVDSSCDTNPDISADIPIPAPLKARFEACAEVIKKQTFNLTNAQQLQVYGLYKQATVGNCDIDIDDAPSVANVVQRAKYKAWMSLSRQEMDQMTAMQEYIDFTMLLEFTKEATATDDQADIVYPDEDHDDQEHVMDMGGMGLKPSTPMQQEEQYYYKEPTTHEEHLERDLHIAARDNQPERLKELLLLQSTTTPSSNVNVNPNSLDETGQTALHLAADRGNFQCVQILLDHGADVHATDQEGISILQAAVIAGHFETCRLLLQKGADPDQQDMDGDTPRECAKDDPELRNLLFRASQGDLMLYMDPEEQEELQTIYQQQKARSNEDGSVRVDVDDDDRYMDALDDIPIELDDDGDM